MSIAIGTPNSAALIRPTLTTAQALPAALPTASQAGREKPDSDTPQAATSSEDSYLISDRTFAFYKDTSGQIITRYVSLRDGTVTYEPTPKLERSATPAIVIKA